MTKFSIQFSLLVIAFFLLWGSFSRVDWLNIFEVDNVSSKLEKELGDLYASQFWTFGKELKKGEVYDTLEEIKIQICEANEIDPDKIKLHVIRTKEVNAFAAPDNHLVIFTGLIDYCESFEEVAGVMAHEIAHMEKNHIMKKLTREVGISVLVSVATSGSVPTDILRLVASTSYDRSMEREADDTAVEYLIEAGIDPLGLADMMYRLSQESNALIKSLEIISTHPDSGKRVESIKKKAGSPQEYSPLLPEQEWSLFQEKATSSSVSML